MNTIRELLLVTCAIVASGSAAASDYGVFTGKYIGPLAELSAEERAWFHSHWQQMSPEERDAVRRKLRREWRDTPPEERQKHRQELADRLRGRPGFVPPPGPGWKARQEDGYGQGYETREWDYRGGERGRDRR